MKLVIKNLKLPEGHAIVTLSNHKRNRPFKEITVEGRKLWISQRNYWVNSKQLTPHSTFTPDSVNYFIHIYDDYYYQGTSNGLSTFEESGVGLFTLRNIHQVNNNPDFFKREIEKMTLKLEY